MSKIINTNVEILGKPYAIRCAETELEALTKAASFLDQKMQEVQDSGKVINLERIAIITALNMAHQFLQMDGQKSNWVEKINAHLTRLQQKLDTVINQDDTELVYSGE